MAVSDARPTILLAGGDGGPSGVPRNICMLARALQDAAEVHVVSEADRGGYVDLKASGARHHVVQRLKSSLNPGHLWRGWCGFLGIVQSRPWSLVWLHARLPVLLGRLALALRLWRPAPETRVALTYHGLPFGPGHRSGMAALSRRVEQALLAACPPLDLIFLTVTQKQRMVTAVGASVLRRHRCHVLPNSSDLGPLPQRPDPRTPGRTLVLTGRVGYQKNYALAVRFFSHLPQDMRLILCGGGTAEPAFQRQMRQIAGPAAARLEFRGAMADIRPVLAEADGYLLTSRYEGTPIGALEACEAGLPLLLSPFETAADVAAGHPMARVLQLSAESMDQDAKSADLLIHEYLVARERHSTEIRAAWKQQWSRSAFDRNAQALLRELLSPRQ
ncbi:glycosyltransferase family 1 protein (plasmid) [Parasedimentitalea marina]|uniref:Glycosyltransferase family 1 protein n=2 Tax=Parasedimentitalea marina TaxID=2483033 RepID=A0A3T0N9B8_9RHOB|nr:glycosyltransferase family 1 protein [Parasedimentitalea marina]